MGQSSSDTLCTGRRSAALLLALPTKRARWVEQRLQISKLSSTSILSHLFYTHPQPLSGVDYRGPSVEACFCYLLVIVKMAKEEK